MKIIHLIIVMVITVGLFTTTAHADPAKRCSAYGDANLLAYCLRPLPGGKAWMDPGTAQVYNAVKNMRPVAPTVIPYGNGYYSPYSYAPVSGNPYYAEPNAFNAFAGAAAGMLSAAAWAYNWKHGYIGAQGVYAASYLTNYPW